MNTTVVEEMDDGVWRKATLDIPDGWYRVLSGAVKPGDRYLAEDLFWDRGEVEWHDLRRFPPPDRPDGTAEWYLCLIRRGEPVEALCPRCHNAPVRHGYRYCKQCSWDVAHELRGQ